MNGSWASACARRACASAFSGCARSKRRTATTVTGRRRRAACASRRRRWLPWRRPGQSDQVVAVHGRLGDPCAAIGCSPSWRAEWRPLCTASPTSGRTRSVEQGAKEEGGHTARYTTRTFSSVLWPGTPGKAQPVDGRIPAAVTVETPQIRKAVEELKDRGVKFETEVLEYARGFCRRVRGSRRSPPAAETGPLKVMDAAILRGFPDEPGSKITHAVVAGAISSTR